MWQTGILFCTLSFHLQHFDHNIIVFQMSFHQHTPPFLIFILDMLSILPPDILCKHTPVILLYVIIPLYNNIL